MSKKAKAAAEQERVNTINMLANNMGQMLLTVTDGDWDLALSVSGVLFASCCAQAAVENDDEPMELFEEAGVGIREATEKFYAAFAAQKLAELQAEKDEQDGSDDADES